jgi:hypothetical protein
LKLEILLIGTCHLFQTRTSSTTLATQGLFKSLVLNSVKQHGVRLVAEETNREVLRIDGVASSICDEVAAETTPSSCLYVDPTSDERERLGIENVDHVRAQIGIDVFMRAARGASHEEIRGEIARRTALDRRVRENHEKREREWVRRLKAKNESPVLLVCGADHVESFFELAKRVGLGVAVLHPDWEPTGEGY